MSSTLNKACSYGRIDYVEPNNFNSNGNDNGSDRAIPHPYEDYCISVDLTVKVPDRNSCGLNDGSDIEIQYTSERGTISFIGGTNGYLTTNYTNISNLNPSNNTNECLGIESIKITYKSWFTPQIDITFIDVRGASLMLPQEQALYNTIVDEHSKKLRAESLNTIKGTSGNTSYLNNATVINGGSFFKALFSFPYPMFILKVKGLYGSEVTYKLSLETFNAEFSPDNGNFKINTTFIGYMYGAFTDIPLTYLVIAPFITYDGNMLGYSYWNKGISETGNYYYLDEDGNKSLPIDSFMDFRNRMSKIGENASKILRNSVENADYNKASKRLRMLNDISLKFNEPSDVALDNQGRALKNPDDDSSVTDNNNVWNYNKSGYYYFVGTVESYINSVENDTYLDLTSNNLKIENYRSVFSDSSLSDLTDILENNENSFSDSNENGAIKKLNKVCAFIKNKKTDEYNDELESYYYTLSGSTSTNKFSKYIEDYPSLSLILDEEGNAISNSYSDIIYIYKLLTKHKHRTELISEKEEAEKNFNDREEKLKKLQNEEISKIVGFNPSIENIYNMAFAHLDVFMKIFYQCLTEIRGQIGNGSRPFSKYNINVSDTDANPNATRESQIPPFPLFIKTENDSREMKFPTDISEEFLELPEVKLTLGILEATNCFDKNVNPNQNANYSGQLKLIKSGNVIATTLYDMNLLSKADSITNPYKSIVDSASTESETISLLKRAYLLRSCYYILTHLDSGEKELMNGESGLRTFGYCESANLYKVIPDDKENPLRKIYDKFVDNVTGHDETYFINDIISLTSTCWNVSYQKQTGMDGLVEVGKKPGLKANNDNMFCQMFVVDNYHKTGQKKSYWPLANFFKPEVDIINNTDKYIGKFSTFAEFNLSKNTSSDDTSTYDEANCFIIDNPYNLYQKYNDNASLRVINPCASDRSSGDIFIDSICDGYINKASNSDETMPSSVFSATSDYTYDIPTKNTMMQLDEMTFDNYKKTLKVNNLFWCSNTDNNSSGYKCVFQNNTGISGSPMSNIYSRTVIFNNESYYAKAYLFLFGIRLLNNDFLSRYNNECRKNGVEIYIELLKEGAFYWRYYNENNNGAFEDPIKIPDGYKQATRNQIYTKTSTSSNKYDGINISSNGTSYTEISDGLILNTSKSRIKTLKDEFVNWVDSCYSKSLDDVFISLCKNQIVETPVNDDNVLGSFYTNLCRILFKAKLILCYNDTAILNSDNIKLPIDLVKKSIKYLKCGLTRIKELEEAKKLSDEANENNENRFKGASSYKLTIYLTLKNLYDKWISCGYRDYWMFENSKSVYKQFKYVDSFYRNIGRKLIVNPTHAADLISRFCPASKNSEMEGEENYQGKSVYEYLHEIASKNNCLMMSIPVMFGLSNRDKLVEMFKPQPYNSAIREDTSTFVVIYMHRPATSLSNEDDSGTNGRSDDGCDIADTTGNIKPLLPSALCVGEEGDYQIPAFGVTFGKGNQSYFTNITLNTQNPMTTEYTILSTMNIASKAAEGPRGTTIYGQDLYRVYSNYSYSVTVEMLGDMEVVPLMYFQLNNIPMWKGAYIITEVNHNISLGKATTSFTGYRISKNSIPLNGLKAIFADNDLTMFVAESQDIETDEVLYTSNIKSHSKSNESKYPYNEQGLKDAKYQMYCSLKALSKKYDSMNKEASTIKGLNKKIVLSLARYYSQGKASYPKFIDSNCGTKMQVLLNSQEVQPIEDLEYVLVHELNYKKLEVGYNLKRERLKNMLKEASNFDTGDVIYYSCDSLSDIEKVSIYCNLEEGKNSWFSGNYNEKGELIEDASAFSHDYDFDKWTFIKYIAPTNFANRETIKNMDEKDKK